MEKAAGRAFRDCAQAALGKAFRTDPPTYEAPHFLGVYRHRCPARAGRSSALGLTEAYLRSPAYEVLGTNGQPWIAVEADRPLVPDGPPEEVIGRVPAGRFGFIYREGRCRGCGQTARSKAGRLVDGWERPPIHRRATRGLTMADKKDQRATDTSPESTWGATPGAKEDWDAKYGDKARKAVAPGDEKAAPGE